MLKEALIASKLLGSGGGGGGDCELALATMNLTNTLPDGFIHINGCTIKDGHMDVDAHVFDEEGTVQVILYHESAQLVLDVEELISMSGNITGDLEDGFEVTGDCAVTCKGWSWG